MHTGPSNESPRAHKTGAKNAAPSKKPTVKKPASKKTAAKATSPTHDELGGMIATAAYYLAERRHFAPGFELDDWLAAERQVLGSSA